MNRLRLIGAVVGLLAIVNAGAAENPRVPFLKRGGWPATWHQSAVVSTTPLDVTDDLSTPEGQMAAEPPDKWVSSKDFGGLPPTIHQASLGLIR
jgi:hypothetical protein